MFLQENWAQPTSLFLWFSADGEPKSYSVARFSLLGTLQELAERLAAQNPIIVEQVARLVLCGGPVEPISISGRIDKRSGLAGPYAYDHSIITLTVASWMTPEHVSRAYAKLRGQATNKNTHLPKSERNLRIFRFVMDRAESQVPRACSLVGLKELSVSRMELGKR